MLLRLLVLLALPVLASAQQLPSSEEGAPLASRYSWLDYDASTQNWSIAQDDRGVVFVANTEGVLEYDGYAWRKRLLPESSRDLVRSLAVNPDGVVYVGGIGVLGRLRPDSTYTLEFEDLTVWIPEEHRDFGDVWTTFSTSEGIVFQTPTHLFRWTGDRMEVWTTDTSFHKAFAVEGEVIVREEGVGLQRLGPAGLEPLAGGAGFADRKVFALMPHPRGLLAAVVGEGLVVLASGREVPLEGVASAYLQSFRPYAGLQVDSAYDERSLYAIATFGGGVLVVDAEGSVIRVYREDVGLGEDDFVIGMTTDQQGGLWLALLDGIIRLDLFGSVSEYSLRQGLRGKGYSAVRHDEALYVATSAGVYQLAPGELGAPEAQMPYSSFVPVAEDIEQAWTLEKVGDDLLVGTNDGAYRLQNGVAEKLQNSQSVAFQIQVSPWDPDLLFVGMKDGVGMLRRRGSNWTDEGYVEGIDAEVRTFAADTRGRVWAGLINEGIALIRPNSAGEVSADVITTQSTTGTVVTGIEGQVLLSSLGGVKRAVETDGNIQFLAIPGLDNLRGVFTLLSRASGGLWVIQDGEMIGGQLRDGRFVEEERLRFGWTQIFSVTEEDGGAMWLLTDSGLLRYDPAMGSAPVAFPALIRRVADGRRETLYGGALSLAATSGDPVIVLPFEGNDIRFEFAAATFAHSDLTEYQTWLVGQQDDWSPWGRETIADYTNLPEGVYTFRVRARDARGRISDDAMFVLRVLPPWYRTVWAYIGYLVGGIAFVWSIVSWQVRKHRYKLAGQRVRNARVERLNSRLQSINARLRRADKLKDDLLANTSHELRTPLTAVLGFAELLLDEADEEIQPLAEGVWRGGKRLLTTVNSLLDMYKLQAGTLELHPTRIDVAEQTRETVALLEPLAREKNLALAVMPQGLPIPADMDTGVLERVLMNLVGNAIKFTMTGSVTVLLDATDESVEIAVRDTGRGIEPGFMPRLFEPFEQASTGHSRLHEGTGLGLAIVHRIVSLAGGSIGVESRLGIGTTFRVTLPRTYTASKLHSRDLMPPASLGGAEVLAITQDGPLAGVLRGIVEPHGRVCATASPLRASREARRHAFDLVVIQASSVREDVRRVAAIRRVPGYEHVAIIRTDGDVLSQEDLELRGFTHQIPVVTDESVVYALLEGLLMKVEARVSE